MGKNFFNKFKKSVGDYARHPIQHISHDIKETGQMWLYPHTNETIIPIPIIGKEVDKGIKKMGGKVLCGVTAGALGCDKGNQHHQKAVESVKEMSDMIIGLIMKGINAIGGIDKLASSIGIPPKVLHDILDSKDKSNTDVMREIGDVANVIGAMADSSATFGNIFGVVVGEQLMQFGTGITSTADLIDLAEGIKEHWDKGEYDQILGKLGDMSGKLADVVGKENAEKLQLKKLGDGLKDSQGKLKTAMEVTDVLKEKLGIQGQEIDKLEKAEEEDRKKDEEHTQAEEKHLDRIQEQIDYNESRNEKGQQIILAHMQEQNFDKIQESVDKQLLLSDHNNHTMLKQIVSDNRGEAEAVRHNTVVLDKGLQKLEDEEAKEVDALARISTTLDRPTTVNDFMKDLDTFDSMEAKMDYVSENYDAFINLQQEDMDMILDKLNN